MTGFHSLRSSNRSRRASLLAYFSSIFLAVSDVPHICCWISRGLASCSGWSAGCSGEGGSGDFQQLQHLALQRGELGFEGLDEVAMLVVEFVAGDAGEDLQDL